MVRQNYEGYSRKEVDWAIQARKLQGRLGNASEGSIKRDVSKRLNCNPLFANCKLNAPDFNRARKLFGPSKECLIGKWVSGKLMRVELETGQHPKGDVILVADVIFVSGLPFLVLNHVEGVEICDRAVRATLISRGAGQRSEGSPHGLSLSGNNYTSNTIAIGR